MKIRRYFFSSFRPLVFITLFFITVRWFLEIVLIQSAVVRGIQRLRFPNGNVKDLEVGHSKQKENIVYRFNSNGLKDVLKSNYCNTGHIANSIQHFNEITTDWNTWTYKRKRNCPTIYEKGVRFTKKPSLLYIHCNTTESLNHEKTAMTGIANKVQSLPFGSPCLGAYLEHCCRTDNHPVPNIVHYIWYGNKKTFSFYGLLSFISVIRFVRPCVILVHGDSLPSGLYWNYVMNIYSNIIQVKRNIRPSIYGKKIKHINHLSDIIRIEVLLQYGGIYLDLDMVLVKKIDFLRRYRCTMSRMRSKLLQSSFIMARKNSAFLRKWQDGYRYHYRNDSYIYSAMNYPNQIANNYSNLIHIEFETLSRPWSQHGDKIYFSNFDWSWLYGMHLYSRLYKPLVNETVIRQMNTTFGALARHILYGNKELCEN